MTKCVYVHLVNEIPVYVGSGSIVRPYMFRDRSPEHCDSFNHKTFRVVIVEDGLTTDEARSLEFDIIQICNKLGFKLLNKTKSTQRVVQLTKEFVTKYVRYDETSPTFLVWAIDRYGGKLKTSLFFKEGDVAGSVRKDDGYSRIVIDAKECVIHRVVWVLHNGEIPPEMVIDHVDGNKKNNNIDNLRCISQSLNCKTKKQIPSKTGIQSLRHYESVKPNTGSFAVVWSDSLYQTKSKSFTYSPKTQTKSDAFKLAMEFRAELIAEGKIGIRGIK